jgi:methylthioribose-1-phosphate isomerase
MKGFETLRWRDGKLEMLDQRALPTTVQYLAYTSANETAAGIRDMVVRGAPAIGVAAAYGVALEASRQREANATAFKAALDAGFDVLAKSRPTAVNLFWALERMREEWRSVAASSQELIAEHLIAAAQDIRAADIAANRAMGRHGAALLANGASVLTHCNAGALATAGHGTALGVIRSAIEAGKSISVYADETRPFLQGARLTAWELMQDGIPVTLIADNAAAFLMSRGEIDAVIVGADRVAANGDVANKIGTYSVAVVANRHRIPFYVAAPISTIDAAITNGAQIPIEERSESEVTGYGDVRWAPTGVKVRNPVFDVTPAELVSALITERGVVHAPDAAKLKTLLATKQH